MSAPILYANRSYSSRTSALPRQAKLWRALFGFIFVILPFFLVCDNLARKIGNTFSRNMVLLAVSLLFYIWGDTTNVFLLLALGVINFFAAKQLHRFKSPLFLAILIAVNLLVLFTVKYAFWVSGFIDPELMKKPIRMPLGISFFTFHAIAALLILTPVGMICFDAHWNADLEQRARMALPELPKKIRGNTMKKYFEKIDKYIADDIPFRGKLIAFAWKFFEDTGVNDDINIVVRGKDNWLFLGNNFANPLDKLKGKFVLHGDVLSATVSRFEQIEQLSKERGADFAVLIGPNKSSVYPEYLPHIIYPSKTRYIASGVEALRQKGMLVVEPTDLLKNSKEKGLLYYRTDSHWNLLGGFIAASMLFEQLNLPAPRNYKLVPGPVFSGGNVELAGYTNFTLTGGDNYILEWEPPFSITIDEAGTAREVDGFTSIDTSVTGKCIKVSNKDAATDKIAWVYTDSFGTALSPFFNATFKEVYYLHHRDFWRDPATPDSAPPDVVITIIVERNFLP